MRRTLARITITAAATAGLVATGLVQALGLGEISVNSDLNQRFSASIPLTEISAEDLETVTVSVAPNEVFDRAGIDRAEYLSSLDFEIKNDRGRPRVVISSGEIAREPVLNLLVQARWSGGKILRDYTILLDPPSIVVAAPPVAVKPPVAPVIAVPVKPAPLAASVVAPKAEFYETPAESKPPKKAATLAKAPPAATDPAFDSATGSYGPVAPRETLWSIATKVRPSPAVSMDQVMLALAEANPVAIQGGTTVNKGAMLKIPSVERIQTTPASAAKAKLTALRGGKSVTKAAVPATAKNPVKGAPEKTTASKPAETPKPATAAAALPELPKPQIALPPVTKTPTAPASSAAPATSPAPVIASKPSAPAATTAPTPAPAAASAAPAAVPSAPAASEPVTGQTATVTAAPGTAVAVTPPATAAPAAAKSPLAQPLPEEPGSSLLDSFGIPLAVGGLLLLLAGGLFLMSRRRKASARAGSSFAKFKPGDTSTVQAPVGGSGAVGKLGDTTRLSDTQVLGAAGGAAFAAANATQQMTQPVTASSSPAAYAPEATLILDPEAVAALNNAVKPSAVSGGAESFDKTTQVQVDTLQISLGDNDPLSEADFHLAYGLYDEAILLLKTATQQQPQRLDLQMKLAETYFAAGRPMEFQEIAEELKDRLNSSDWSKIAIMGSQICPDVSIFQSSGGDAGLDTDFDLAFDEPAAPAAPVPAPAPASNSIDFSIFSPTTAAIPSAAVATSMVGDGVLDLDLGEDSASSGLAQRPAELDDESSIDFMLGQSLTPLGAGMKVPTSSDLLFNLGAPSFNVDIPKLELASFSKSTDDGIADMNERPTLAPVSDGASFSLQDLAVSITPRESVTESIEDELNTKLDLARAYVEMGDNDMARSLLQEVQQQGGERYKQEAASLLQRLPA